MATFKTSADKPASESSSSSSSPVSSSVSVPSAGSRRTDASNVSDADFQTVTIPKKQAIGLLYGRAKVGKSAFLALFAPTPACIINLDGRCDPAIADATALGRDVRKAVVEYPTFYMDPPEMKIAAAKSMERFFALCERASQTFRSCMIDTGTELDDIFKLAFDGVVGERTKEGAIGKDIYFVNNMWRRVFNIFNKSACHLIVAARETEVWDYANAEAKSKTPTGVYKPTISRVPFDACTVVMQITAERNKGIKSDAKINSSIKIMGSGARWSELGNVYTQEDWKEHGPFAYVFWKQFEKTTKIEEWE